MEKTMSKNWMHNFKPSVEVRELREELSEEELVARFIQIAG